MLKYRTKKPSLPGASTGQTIVAQLLILWLCTLPLIALIIAPIFGPQVALYDLPLVTDGTTFWGVTGAGGPDNAGAHHQGAT